MLSTLTQKVFEPQRDDWRLGERKEEEAVLLFIQTYVD